MEYNANQKVATMYILSLQSDAQTLKNDAHGGILYVLDFMFVFVETFSCQTIYTCFILLRIV